MRVVLTGWGDLFCLENRPDCLIYSAGSNGDFSFEVDMQKFDATL
jgi:hypothetical protein